MVGRETRMQAKHINLASGGPTVYILMLDCISNLHQEMKERKKTDKNIDEKFNSRLAGYITPKIFVGDVEICSIFIMFDRLFNVRPSTLCSLF